MTILSSQGRRRMLAVGTLLGLGFWLEGWIGVLLLAVAADLAVFRRPFSARPICWPGLGVTAAGLALRPGPRFRLRLAGRGRRRPRLGHDLAFRHRRSLVP